MRFHLLGLVHLPVSERYMACAFTQKIVKLSKMLLSLGHEVFLYGCESSDAPCTKFIQTHTLGDVRDAWGGGDNRFELGYNWKSDGFRHDFNASRKSVTRLYYANTIEAINSLKKQDDFLLLSQGTYQKPIADGAGLYLTCEPGIGYRGSMTTSFRAFESHYLQSFAYGSEHPFECVNGSYYDRVIPNYFDPKDFTFSDKSGDYFLYMGRVIQRKGVNTAVKVSNSLDEKLIIAGQGRESGILEGPKVQFVGYADAKRRAELLSNARATFVPSIYLEAFGGIAIESMLSGTPVITTNFGVFPEYNFNGMTGYCCDTLADFVQAAKTIDKLDRRAIHDYALKNFSMDEVRWRYQKWFEDLYKLYESVQDSSKLGWHRV